MNCESLFEKFDLFADAPDAVARIRELVVKLAVQGQLSDDANSWREAPLGEIARLRRGYDLPVQNRKGGGYPIYAANGPVGFHESPKIRGPGVVTGRSGSIGKVHFVHDDYWPLNTSLYVEDFFGNDPQFICLLLQAMRLERFSTSTAVPTLNRNIVHKEIVRVPLPAEQRRIVAKVDELMALCDRLEAQQQERDARQAELARAALARFAEAPTPANLNWIFHSAFNIPPSDLRKCILTLAIQGKLVHQDPRDEPAQEMIERVSATLPDKRNGNPFIDKIEGSITDESLYELPRGWAWLPLGQVGIWATGFGFPTQYQGESDKEYLFCKVSDMNLPGNEVEIHKTVHTIDAEVMKRIRARDNPAGTVIFPKIGGAIATHKRRLVIKPTIIDNNCLGIQPVGLTDDRWLLLFMRNLDLTKYQSGTSVPAVSQAALDPIRIGLPPLAEQRRIVAKVDELMAFVDSLEDQLAAARVTGANLLAAAVAQLTNGKDAHVLAEV